METTLEKEHKLLPTLETHFKDGLLDEEKYAAIKSLMNTDGWIVSVLPRQYQGKETTIWSCFMPVPVTRE